MITDAKFRRWVQATLRSRSAPEPMRLVWSWFVDLHATRTRGMTGPNPISFQEIEAYARLHRWPMEPRHVDLIRAFDMEWLKQQQPADGVAPKAPPQSISPAAFDAVFG